MVPLENLVDEKKDEGMEKDQEQGSDTDFCG